MTLENLSSQKTPKNKQTNLKKKKKKKQSWLSVLGKRKKKLFCPQFQVHRRFKRATGVAEGWPFIIFFIGHAGLAGETGPSPDSMHLTVMVQTGSSPGPAPAAEWGILDTCSPAQPSKWHGIIHKQKHPSPLISVPSNFLGAFRVFPQGATGKHK